MRAARRPAAPIGADLFGAPKLGREAARDGARAVSHGLDVSSPDCAAGAASPVPAAAFSGGDSPIWPVPPIHRGCLRAWAAGAAPGASVVYLRGDIEGFRRQDRLWKALCEGERAQLANAAAAEALAEGGVLRLSTRRACGATDYIATRSAA